MPVLCNIPRAGVAIETDKGVAPKSIGGCCCTQPGMPRELTANKKERTEVDKQRRNEEWKWLGYIPPGNSIPYVDVWDPLERYGPFWSE